MIPSGTLRKNAQRQVRLSIRAPPTAGPIAVATPPTAPSAPTAVERRSTGNSSSTSASEAGDSMASPAAWTMRAAMRKCTVGAVETRRLPTMNVPKPMRNIRARPNRSAAQPAGTKTAAVVIENAVSVHETVPGLASKVASMSPNATKTSEKLSVASATAPAISP